MRQRVSVREHFGRGNARPGGAGAVVISGGDLMGVDGSVAPRQLDHHPPPPRALFGPPFSRQSYHPPGLDGLTKLCYLRTPNTVDNCGTRTHAMNLRRPYLGCCGPQLCGTNIRSKEQADERNNIEVRRGREASLDGVVEGCGARRNSDCEHFSSSRCIGRLL
jgi:hypothetical protein